tara:strand:- start:4205 stop:4792 length:588 start_codon:yes stop_codon:yes gene_type:complete
VISLTSPYDALLLAVSAIIVLVMAVVFSWFIVRVRQTIKEQNNANAILTDILTNIYDTINEKEKRIVDLMYRVDILEARTKTQYSSVSMPKNEVISNRYEAVVRGSTVDESGVRGGIGSGITKISLELTPTEEMLLKNLINGPKRISEIKGILGKSREHTSRLVSGLSKKGLIKKGFVSGQTVCHITDKGRDIIS